MSAKSDPCVPSDARAVFPAAGAANRRDRDRPPRRFPRRGQSSRPRHSMWPQAGMESRARSATSYPVTTSLHVPSLGLVLAAQSLECLLHVGGANDDELLLRSGCATEIQILNVGAGSTQLSGDFDQHAR